jgi:hypothetical protein
LGECDDCTSKDRIIAAAELLLEGAQDLCDEAEHWCGRQDDPSRELCRAIRRCEETIREFNIAARGKA